MEIKKKFYVVNSFTNKQSGGNAAGIFINSGNLQDSTMQKIAQQLNLVETVFINESNENGVDFEIRYFTPESEVQIAGHPTVAAFIALAKIGELNLQGKDKYTIRTKDGIKDVTVEVRGNDIFVRLKQKSPKFGEIIHEKNEVCKVLGIDESDLINHLSIQCINTGLGHLVVPINSLAGLMNIKRNISELKALCNKYGVREVQAFCFETRDNSFDIHTRNICPRQGIEDAACGIGNAALGAYILKNCASEKEKISIKAEQGDIIGVPCAIEINAYKEEQHIEVEIGGTGKILVQGEFIISNL